MTPIVDKERYEMTVKKTFWDIYYWIQAQVEFNGKVPEYEIILKRYKHYDKEIIEEGIAFYKSQSQTPVRKSNFNRSGLKMDKKERLEAINKLITFISERGRRFFYCKSKDRTAYMKIKNGRVYFVDDYTEEDVYAYTHYTDRNGFSHGGTLWAMVCDFSEYIRKGNDANGSHGYSGLYSEYWGYDDESTKEIIIYARELGYLTK